MNVEDREQFWAALDFLAARARSGEQTLEDVRAFACEMHDHIVQNLTPSLWHRRCFDEALGMLRWNLGLQRRHVGATTGLTLALSALRLATAPKESIDLQWQAKTDPEEFKRLGAALRAVKAKVD